MLVAETDPVSECIGPILVSKDFGIFFQSFLAECDTIGDQAKDLLVDLFDGIANVDCHVRVSFRKVGKLQLTVEGEPVR
jgi:hypothetical protein